MDGHDFFEPLQLYNQTLPKIMQSLPALKRGRVMRHAIPRFSSLAVSLGITGLFGYPADVRAQAIFCPRTSCSVKRVVHRWHGRRVFGRRVG